MNDFSTCFSNNFMILVFPLFATKCPTCCSFLSSSFKSSVFFSRCIHKFGRGLSHMQCENNFSQFFLIGFQYLRLGQQDIQIPLVLNSWLHSGYNSTFPYFGLSIVEQLMQMHWIQQIDKLLSFFPCRQTGQCFPYKVQLFRLNHIHISS